MSTLLFGRQAYVEPAEGADEARSTITVVDNESATPEATTAPEFNHVEKDPDTEGGLTTRDVSDIVHGSERFAPVAGNANTDFSTLDNQVSSSGTAASRESGGQWGHGTARWSDATEPTIREGASFNDTYFSANRPTIQEGSLDYMTAPRNPDDATAAGTNAAATVAARKAATAAMYQRFLDDGTT